MQQPTFFFYDLETSGLDPRQHRIMQFAGQRTTMDLEPVGEPVNVLVSLSEDILPDPYAIKVTGITPQKTREEGYSEADFLKLLHDQVLTPNTTIIGFNSIRFDDEFMRYTLYRNFYDPYEWQWKEDRSRWDMLDAIRMTRALRPDGIEWPVDAEGNATNRLELITKANNIDHFAAHDAMSDVHALIAVAKLVKEKQPKLFDYLFGIRGKHKVAELVNLDNPQPFVYSSGRYPKDFLHTTVAYPIAPGSTPGSVLVYDLRHDPTDWAGTTTDDLKKIRFAKWEDRKKPDFKALPVKELATNKAPAVAPLGVLDAAAQERIGLDIPTAQKHLGKLLSTDLADRMREVFERGGFAKHPDVDGQLYESFIPKGDAIKMSAVRAADRHGLLGFDPGFNDERLGDLLLRYKARNFPQSLTGDERTQWEEIRSQRLQKDMPAFTKGLAQLAASTKDDKTQFLLQELQLWAESIVPLD